VNIQDGLIPNKVIEGDGKTLSDAYDLWLHADHPKKAGTLNRARSKTDLLNHKRALHCFATGCSNGSKSAEQIPLSALEATEPLVAKQVVRGVELLTAFGKSKPPKKKTVSNLVSCLKAIRAVVLEGRSVPPQGKSARKQLSELPKRRSRIGFPLASWPSRFATEWSEYREWKIKPILTASEGAAYRRARCRLRTIG
jgi:hypothetical protein